MIRVTVTVTVYPSVYRHEGYPVDVSYTYYVRVQFFTRGVRFIIEQSYIFQRMFGDFTACFCYWQVLASSVYSARILRFQLIRFHLSPTLEFLTHLQTVDSKRYLFNISPAYAFALRLMAPKLPIISTYQICL